MVWKILPVTADVISLGQQLKNICVFPYKICIYRFIIWNEFFKYCSVCIATTCIMDDYDSWTDNYIKNEKKNDTL